MLDQLRQHEFEKVRPLFAGLGYQLSSVAVIEGTVPGRIWVDDMTQPRTAFMVSPEGHLLAGDEHNQAFNRALNKYIMNTILAGEPDAAGSDAIVLICDPETWEAKLDVVLAGRVPIRERRMHFLLDRPKIDWRSSVPDGYRIERLDGKLLGRAGVTLPRHAERWMENSWRSVDGFVRDAFGFCALRGDQLVCWCLADCISHGACEIGIRTAEEHRRRGLATATVAATVDYCLAHGLTSIGWHSHVDNLGSRSVATKVGFVKERDYVHYLCLADETEHLALLGTHNVKDGR